MRLSVVLASLAIAIVGCATPPPSSVASDRLPNPCTNDQQLRAAFDIGSSSTKVKVGCVSHTDSGPLRYELNSKIKKKLEDMGRDKELKKNLNYRDDLASRERQNRGCFSDGESGIANKGISIIEELKERVEAVFQDDVTQQIEYRSAATAAFRNAMDILEERNGTCDGGALISANKLIERINEKHQINAEIADQKLEGKLEFLGVVSDRKVIGSKVSIVLGVGSSNTQVTMRGREGEPQSIPGVGQVRLKEFIIGTLQASALQTPNPMSAYDAHTAKQLVQQLTESRLTRLRGIAETQAERVYGVGGSVQYLQLVKNIPENPKDEVCFPRREHDGGPADLARINYSICVRTGLGAGQDCKRKEAAIEVKLCNRPKHRPTEVSNLLLVSATMEALGATELKWVDAGLADGLLVIDQWPPQATKP